jgi:S-sulfosulfanyl-L-cysteine sulfohydrolase
MNLNRREFVRLMEFAGAAGVLPRPELQAGDDGFAPYDTPSLGNPRILNIADRHAQLNPVYFR